MIKSATAQLNQDKRAGRMMQYATAGFIDSDCDPVDRVCANDALRQFNALINGSVTLEKDKYWIYSIKNIFLRFVIIPVSEVFTPSPYGVLQFITEGSWNGHLPGMQLVTENSIGLNKRKCSKQCVARLIYIT